MKTLPIHALIALLCAALLFSCAPEIEPLQLNEQNSSSDTEQPTWSQPNRSSSSRQQSPISSPTVQSSSSIQLPTSSPTTQSSSSAQPSIPSSSSLEEISNEPRLVGTCRWDIKVSETTTARGAVPSGVTLVDTDKVCGGAKVVYKYDDGEKTWSSTGILSEWKNWDKKHSETYSGVQATIDCPDYEDDIEPKDCPSLIVNAGAGADYIIECNGGWENSQCNKKEVNLKADECVEINVLKYTGIYLPPRLLMRCNLQATQADVSLTLKLNGKNQSFTGWWSWNGEVILGAVKQGDNEFGTLCVTDLIGAAGVKCTGPGE